MILDVSVNNGVIDWAKVSTNPEPIEGVYIKANEGYGYNDGKLVYNATQADKNGFPIGYYHFATLNNNADVAGDARQEAQFFVSQVLLLPKARLPHALDIETNKSGLTSQQVLLWINTYFAALTSVGLTDYVIYSYTPFLDANLPVNHGLGHIRLWLAGYVPENRLRIPKGWANYWLWQYSNTGSVTGINGHVDISKKQLIT